MRTTLAPCDTGGQIKILTFYDVSRINYTAAADGLRHGTFSQTSLSFYALSLVSNKSVMVEIKFVAGRDCDSVFLFYAGRRCESAPN